MASYLECYNSFRSGTSCKRPWRSISQARSQLVAGSSHTLSSTCFWGQQIRQVQLQYGGQRLRLDHQQPRARMSQTVRAAFFGVGAPEALLVGVVALVVFGPKGLAQAVKSLGATLRTFSPTIKELASVTNELSSSLSEQIGLDEIRNEFRNPSPAYRPVSRDEDSAPSEASAPSQTASNGSSVNGPADLDDASDADIEAKIAESKRLAWGTTQSPRQSASRPRSEEPDVAASQEPAKASRSAVTDLSIEELEAELKQRRKASSNTKLQIADND